MLILQYRHSYPTLRSFYFPIPYFRNSIPVQSTTSADHVLSGLHIMMFVDDEICSYQYPYMQVYSTLVPNVAMVVLIVLRVEIGADGQVISENMEVRNFHQIINIHRCLLRSI